MLQVSKPSPALLTSTLDLRRLIAATWYVTWHLGPYILMNDLVITVVITFNLHALLYLRSEYSAPLQPSVRLKLLPACTAFLKVPCEVKESHTNCGELTKTEGHLLLALFICLHCLFYCSTPFSI